MRNSALRQAKPAVENCETQKDNMGTALYWMKKKKKKKIKKK
jgi:hypothetical protein